MWSEFCASLSEQISDARSQGLFKQERIITSSQQADIQIFDKKQELDFSPMTTWNWKCQWFQVLFETC